MKKLRWQLLIIFLTGLVVGVLLLSEQPVDLPAVELKPAEKGSYTEALIGSVQRLNPVLDFYNSADRDVNRLLYSGLLRFDGRGNPIPDLAESWGISEDGTVYNFLLREDAKWHDGEPVTAEDILFTVEMLRQGEGVVPEDLRTFWQAIEVTGKGRDVQFLLPEPFAPFLDYLTFGILPYHLLGEKQFDELRDDPFNLQPIGSGPYRLQRWIVEGEQIQGVVLEANGDYYGTKAGIETVIFRYYPDSASALQAYREGLVQGISEITLDVLPDAMREPGLSLYTGRRPEISLVLFNLKDQKAVFLQNVEMRRALYMAINRQALINEVLDGQALLANGVVFPGTWAYYDGLPAVNYDPEKALSLIKQAGYVLAQEGDTVRRKGDDELSLTMIYPDTPTHRALAERIADDWRRLGVGVTLEALPYDQLVADRLTPRAYQVALVDLNLARSPDPDPYPFWDQVQAQTGQNYSQWDNRTVSEYLEQARVTVNRSERERLYRNFQMVFADELPALPLFYPVYTYGVIDKIYNVRMGALFDSSDRLATILQWSLVNNKPQVEKTP
jgi:peptide/nickel transport system substrate-binding protein